MRFDDPALANARYQESDVDEIEVERGKPYSRLRVTVRALDAAEARIVILEAKIQALGGQAKLDYLRDS
jgi:hypothetical protein